jgi:hypothetical protein
VRTSSACMHNLLTKGFLCMKNILFVFEMG